MKSPIFLLLPVAAVSLLGQATRTWISGVGDDVNPCSRTAPCKSFAGAISKTSAGGEMGALDPLSSSGVTITKSMTLNGSGTLVSIIATGTSGVIVNAGAADIVILRNIHIKNAGSGVKIQQAGRVELHNCVIESGTDSAISFTPSNSGAQLLLSNVRISDMAGNGVTIAPAAGSVASAMIERSTIAGTAVGVEVSNGGRLFLRDSSISNTSGAGVQVITSGTASTAFLEKSSISGAGTNGVHSGPGASIVRINDISVTASAKGLHLDSGGLILSFGNNKISGNTVEGAATSTVGQK